MRSVTGLPILNAAQRQSFDALLSPLPTVSLEQVNQRARMMSRMDRKIRAQQRPMRRHTRPTAR